MFKMSSALSLTELKEHCSWNSILVLALMSLVSQDFNQLFRSCLSQS